MIDLSRCVRAFARCGIALSMAINAGLLGLTHSDSALATPAYISGHGDIGVAYHVHEGEGELELHYHLMGTGTNLPTNPSLYDGGVISLGTYIGYEEDHPGAWGADEILTLVPEAAKRTNPNANIRSALGITGTASTDVYWRLPQTNETGIPFFGLASEDLADDTGATWSPITFTLKGVSGPGNFALWEVDSESNFNLFWESVGGVVPEDKDVVTLGGDHEHYTWAFSEPGLYGLTLEASGTRTFGGVSTPYTSEQAVFTFQVVPEPGSMMLAGIGCLGTVGASWLRRRNSRTRRQ
jgi:surface-anchored protein